MIYVILVIILSTFAGFLVTCFLNTESIIERVTYGFVIGIGLFTWFTYLFSLFFGLGTVSILFSILLVSTIGIVIFICSHGWFKQIVCSECLALKNRFQDNRYSYIVHLVVFTFFSFVFCRLFYRTIIWHDGDMFIGLPNNYGDLPLHLSYITSFVWGDNIPPQDPIFAGERLAYPILADFLSAIFLKLGLDFRDMVFVPGYLLTMAFFGTLYYFVYRLTRKRVAALTGVFIFFFAGGFGFYYFFQDLNGTQIGLNHFLSNIPRDYTKINDLNYHWITPLTCLNVPQRALLFGFPVTMMIFSVLYTGIESMIVTAANNCTANRKASLRLRLFSLRSIEYSTSIKNCSEWSQFVFAGVLAGTLPFFHTHSFMAMLMVTIPLGILFWDWRKWFLFFFPAFILSLPQILYFSGQVKDGFFQIHFGWLAGKENFLWFWLKNTGLFWPVYLGSLLFIIFFWKKSAVVASRTANKHTTKTLTDAYRSFAVPLFVYFSALFLLLFLFSNIFLFAPSKWDNIKLLIYWFLGSIPIASVGLACLYECKRYKIATRIAFFIIMVVLMLAGGIDLFKYTIMPVHRIRVFSRDEVHLSKQMISFTAPDSLFLAAPTFNHPVYLSGRKTLLGYLGHIWSHGYKGYSKRERDIKEMLKGGSGTHELIKMYGLDYATIGPHEKHIGVNKRFFDKNYECIISTESYHVYDLNKRVRSDIIQKMEKDLISKGYGLRADYFQNINWSGKPIIAETQLDISFNWLNENQKPLSSPFSALWQGFLNIEVTGKYTFKLVSDDGSWLFIDGKKIIDNGGSHAARAVSGGVFLDKGVHEIVIKYFDGGGGAVMELMWTLPGGEETMIPVERLKVTK